MKQIDLHHRMFTKPLRVFTRMDAYEQVARWQRYSEDVKRRFVDPVVEDSAFLDWLTEGTALTIVFNLLGIAAVIGMFVLRK